MTDEDRASAQDAAQQTAVTVLTSDGPPLSVHVYRRPGIMMILAPSQWRSHTFVATILGRYGPSAPGQVGPGVPSPPAWLTPKDAELEEQQTTERLSVLLVASN